MDEDDLDIVDADQYAGLTADTGQDDYTGDLGDGSGTSQDFLSSALTSASQLSTVVNTATSLLNGGKSTQATVNGSPVSQPIAVQSGALSAQNAVAGLFKKIPMWGWAIAGITILFGLFAILSGGGRKRA